MACRVQRESPSHPATAVLHSPTLGLTSLPLWHNHASNPTIPQSRNPAIPQSRNPAIPQSRNPAIPQSRNPAIPLSDSLLSLCPSAALSSCRPPRLAAQTRRSPRVRRSLKSAALAFLGRSATLPCAVTNAHDAPHRAISAVRTQATHILPRLHYHPNPAFAPRPAIAAQIRTPCGRPARSCR